MHIASAGDNYQYSLRLSAVSPPPPQATPTGVLKKKKKIDREDGTAIEHNDGRRGRKKTVKITHK
jgi:hypothetical protein